MSTRFVVRCCLILAVVVPLQAAASQAEIETYARLLRRVIDREIEVVARRRLEDFQQVAGAGAVEGKILQLHFARTFAFSASGDEAKQLQEQAAALERDLMPLADRPDIDADLRSLIRREPLDVILSLVNPIFRDLNPSLPPPSADLLPSGFHQRNEQRLRLLMQAIDNAVPAKLEVIAAYDPTYEEAIARPEWNDPEWEIIFQATRLRLEVVNYYYIGLKTFNEVLARGQAFGFDPALIQDIDTWLAKHMKEHGSTFGDWDFQFGDFNLDFKHRTLVVRMEAARGHGIRYTSPSETIPYIEEMLELDVSQFRGSNRRLAEDLKMRFLGETMLWSMALASTRSDSEQVDRVQRVAVRFWRDAYRDLRKDLRSNNAQRSGEAANLFFMAARLFLSMGRTDDAMGLMSDIQSVRPPHRFAFNARTYQQWMLMQGDTGEVDWGAPIRPQDPESALSVAHSFRRAASQRSEPAERQELLLKAATTLRNGIAGLSEPDYAHQFVEYAPRVYQLYAFVFREMGWMEHASLAAEAGIQAVRPLWGEPRDNFDGNPWGDPRDRDKLDGAGQMVQRLLDDFYRYSGQVRRELDTPMNNDRYRRANEWRREMNPNAEGGEKLEVITLIQDGAYRQAIAAAKRYRNAASELSDQIWFQSAAVRSCFLWLDEESRAEHPSQDQIAEVLALQEPEVAELRRLIAPELEKGEEALEVALSARALIIASEVVALVRAGDNLGIMQMLDEDFWQRVTDRRTQSDMLNQLCAAAVRHRDAISREFSADPQPDPEPLLESWPYYKHALDSLRMIEERFDQEMAGNRTRLGRVMQAVSRHSRWFVENIENQAEGFTDIEPADYARLIRMARESTIAYIDLHEPTLPPDTDIVTWVAFGNDLWSIGAKERALPFYERYLTGVAAREDLQAYRENPAAVVDPVGQAIITARGSYRPQWDAVRDFLVDAPELIERYRQVQGDESKLNERKVDYPQAYDLLTSLREEMERDRALLGDTSTLFPMVDDLIQTVRDLAWSLIFQSRMAQAYMELGQVNRAVELSGELIAYDPMYPPYMTIFVEGVLSKGPEATEAELREARDLAAIARNMARPRAEMVMQFWTSAVQVLELSIMLGDIPVAQRILQRYAIDQNEPTRDLRIAGTDPAQARDAGDVAIWRRFLRLFETEGITVEPPYRIEEDDEGNTVAILIDR